MFISFFDEIPVNKQNSPRLDAAFCQAYMALQLKKVDRIVFSIENYCR